MVFICGKANNEGYSSLEKVNREISIEEAGLAYSFRGLGKDI